MNDIQIFSNPEFGEVRTAEENGTVLFCGSDVAKALGYSNPSKALADHCRGDLTNRYPIVDSLGRTQEAIFIPEPDLYRLVFSSKLPTAEKFTDWVTAEVLPSIRKHGAYMTENTLESMIASPEFGIKLLTALQEEREQRVKLEAKVESDAPKVLFADAVNASHTTILVGELAKLLKQNGKDIGQNRLFAYLRDNGYLIKRSGRDYNMPTQRSMERGWFTIKERTVQEPNGSISVKKTPLVTGKGQQYFINLFLGQ